MTILDSTDQDIARLWSIVTELSEQLSQNRSASVSLYGQVSNLKNEATHAQTGFVLRRYNLDKPQELYDAELEKMTSAVSAENQMLQHDNRQLNTLLKEYEQTLETLMSAFRNRARDVQERELSLIREYEARLLAREEEKAELDLAASSSVLNTLTRISHLLRAVLRLLGGEDEDAQGASEAGTEDRELWNGSGATAEWALEREIELSRLEHENAMLRRLLGAGSGGGSVEEVGRGLSSQKMQAIEGSKAVVPGRVLAGTRGTIGPFGTYKVRSSAV